jgi:hypothetical protein
VAIASPVSASTWLPLLRDALAREGSFRFPLRGNSMRPTLPLMCDIEVIPLPPRVRPGDLIVFAAGDTLIAHRLVRQARGRWIAQGDARLGPDRPLSPDQVLGIVAAAYADGQRCWPNPFSGPLAAFWVARHWALRPLRFIWRITRRSFAILT